ncbi:TQXA domain-containing protein [Corynebacterium sp. CCM 9186]|uniref:SpaA isopeptide-forming pilin-related protein n=1 Tax=Corynebacterium meridianum TaxID=2765363 RepID=UPI002005E2AA|nr:TQXA domain-containing protein [Corynebacterium meridianum]MCK7677095.1 TQXA domain-containing protein [Corynebacterium meridianum]
MAQTTRRLSALFVALAVIMSTVVALATTVGAAAEPTDTRTYEAYADGPYDGLFNLRVADGSEAAFPVYCYNYGYPSAPRLSPGTKLPTYKKTPITSARKRSQEGQEFGDTADILDSQKVGLIIRAGYPRNKEGVLDNYPQLGDAEKRVATQLAVWRATNGVTIDWLPVLDPSGVVQNGLGQGAADALIRALRDELYEKAANGTFTAPAQFEVHYYALTPDTQTPPGSTAPYQDFVGISEGVIPEIPNVEFSKVDATGGEELEGAHLAITDADGETVHEWVSGTTPTTLALIPGTYTLTETATPDTTLYPTPAESIIFRVTDTGTVEVKTGDTWDTVTTVIMKNTRAPETPVASSTTLPWWVLLLIPLGVIGITGWAASSSPSGGATVPTVPASTGGGSTSPVPSPTPGAPVKGISRKVNNEQPEQQPTEQPVTGRGLANTGANVTTLVLGALVLMVLGGVFLIRRRRD